MSKFNVTHVRRPGRLRSSSAAGRSLLIFLFCVLVSTSPAVSHDVVGLLKHQTDTAADEIDAALSEIPPADIATRSVLSNLLLWPVPRALNICFLAGSKATRKRVADAIIKVWPVESLTQSKLSFDRSSFSALEDCDESHKADISVDFKSGDGYWSYVGIESTNHVPSMNLQDFSETSPPNAELYRLTGHEMGHALGLQHEHQSPGAPDCGWDFSYIAANYSWKSAEEMQSNFDKLDDYIQNDKHAYTFSAYDRLSLMHYDFPVGAYLNGNMSPCFIQRNMSPSQQDLNALRVAYGPDLVRNQSLTRGVGSIDSLLSRGKYKEVVNLQSLKSTLLGKE